MSEAVSKMGTRLTTQLGADTLSSQMTPLVRYGLVALAAIAGFFLLDGLSNSVDTARQAKQDLLGERTTLQTLEPAPVWSARLEEATRLRDRATSDLWTAETVGLLQAELVQALTTAHAPSAPTERGANIRDARPTVTSDPELADRDGTSVLPFSMSARLARHGVDDILVAMAAQTPPIYIEEMIISLPDRESIPASLSLEGYIRAEIAADEATP